jgi:two-component system, LytTR family, sensor kinase
MRRVPATPTAVAFIQTLPWIPLTLGAIALGSRFPLARGAWLRPAAIHLVALVCLTFVANLAVVMSYTIMGGRTPVLGTTLRSAAMWTTLRFHVGLLIYAASVAATHAVLYYRRTRERELHVAKLEGQLARAHLQTLNAQIRPHFLFNTLHTIGQLWRSGRSDDADAVLDHLGGLFHKVQSSTSRFEVSLPEELEMVREYLAIEQTRFRDRLETSVRASDRAMSCLVPPLILQPLVENAIRHGISAVSTARTVEVTADVQGERLELSVRDDGPGMSAPSTQRGSGMGLRNTRERLAQLYGGDATLAVLSPPGGGTLVRLSIPLGNGAKRHLDG